MADARRIIEYVFTGTDQLSGTVDSMGANLGAFADSLESGTQPLADLTTGLLKFEATVVAAGLALAAFSVNEAGKFDASMRELTTLINGGEQDLADFSSTLQDMGRTSVASLDDLTGAMYKAVSQTGNLEDAQQAVNAAERLAIAGRADLTDSTLLLVGTLASYGKEMEDAAHFSDVFFSVVQNGQTTLPELAAGLGNVAPTAASAGVSIEDLGAAIALLTKSGIGTSEAMTGIKAALANILSPTKEATDTAKALGLQFDTAAIASKGFAGFIADVAEKTGGSTEKISSLFGSIEAFNSVMVLARDEGSQFAAMLKAIQDGAGSTERAYALMVDTFTARNQQIVNNLRLVGIAFGSEILDPVGNVQDAITGLLQALATSIQAGAFDPLFDAASGALNNLATTLNQIAAIFPQAAANLDFSGLLAALRELAGTVGAIFDGVDLTTPEGLNDALQAIVNTAETFVRVTKGIADVVVPIVAEFVEWAAAGNNLGEGTKELVGQVLGLGTAVNVLAPGVSALASSLTLLSTVMGAGTLLSNFDKLSALATSTAGSIVGKAGLVAAAGAGGFALGQLADDTFGITEALKPLTQAVAAYVTGPSADLVTASDAAGLRILEQMKATQGLTDASSSLTDAQREQAQALALTIPQWEELNRTVSLIGGTFDEAADSQVAAVEVTKTAVEQQADAIDGLIGKWSEASTGARDLSLAAELSTKGFKAQQIQVTDTETGLVRYVDALTFAADSAEDAGDKTSQALSEAAKETLEAQKAANEFALEWEKIASEERQLVFQLSADIAIAQIEAGTERVKAAFESVNTTIESTGTTLVGLAGILADIGGGAGSGIIIDLIEEENERRQQALDLQKQLVESQVKYLDAVTSRLTQGGATIQVTADGLEPELEAFMFRILERIQVRANAEAQQFLLGL